MTQRRELFLAAAMAICLSLAGPAVAQNTSITIQANTGGQSAGGISIDVLVSSMKYSPGTPPTGTTDNTGAFVVPSDVVSSIGAHAQIEVYEYVCVNGQTVLFI